ncbi:MAG: hypothetical protein WDA06_04060 [Phenylobacterium sp.]
MKTTSNRNAFLQKVELMESWVAAGGVPEGEFCPRGPTGLAKWTDPDRGLQAWSSPNVAAPAPSGLYPDLRLRFDQALQRLSDPAPRPRVEARVLKRQLQGLAEQVAILALEHRAMAQELARERQLKEIAQAELAKARAELTRIVPFR